LNYHAVDFAGRDSGLYPAALSSVGATDTLAKITGDIFLCPAAETDGERAEETVV
jgi:hypothetical protein